MNKKLFVIILLTQSAIASPLQIAGENLKEVKLETHNRGGNSCRGKIAITKDIVREGKYAYQHVVPRCANRSEIRMQPTKIGESYWQKWSLYIPKDYSFQSSHAHIFSQWSAFPTSDTTVLPCQGVGHAMLFDKSDNTLTYKIQGSSNPNGKGGGFCKSFLVLPNFNKLKGQWIDFIQYAKWTGDNTGVIKLWVRVGKESSYKPVINYRGVTWWNDESNGPVMKMGLYKGGSGNWKGGKDQAIVYTDSYKLYAGKASFQDIVKTK